MKINTPYVFYDVISDRLVVIVKRSYGVCYCYDSDYGTWGWYFTSEKKTLASKEFVLLGELYE